MATELKRIPEKSRYLYLRDGEQVGLADYQVRGNAIRVLHTEINPAYRRQGMADAMVEAVLEDIRTETALKLVPVCPFVAAWLDRHPEYCELENRG